MKSRITARFRAAYARLPRDVQRQARAAYRRFRDNPNLPGLPFQPVIPELGIYSVRVSYQCRALGTRRGDEIVWLWIGSHAEYDRILDQFNRSR